MKKTNILLITSDQQHFDTIGALNSEISTPNLDRLVREGRVDGTGTLARRRNIKSCILINGT
jgi:hypothetical protein